MVKPLAGELVLLSVEGVTAKWDSIGDCNRLVAALEYSSTDFSVESVEDSDTSLRGFAMPQTSLIFFGGTVNDIVNFIFYYLCRRLGKSKTTLSDIFNYLFSILIKSCLL